MELVITVTAAAFIGYILHEKPLFGVIIAIFAATLGEFSRLPEYTNLPYLFNDLFMPILIIVWLIKKIALDRDYKTPPLLLPIIVWCTIGGISLIANSSWLETSQLKESAMYLIRFIEYFFLYLITADEASKSAQAWKTILFAIITGALLISVFGFFQLQYYPSFYDLNLMAEGWDPHIGRLLSTWFDPNFVGGLLSFVICIIFGIITGKQKKSLLFTVYSLLSISCLLIALYLTYSRSSYLACGIGLLAITGVRSRKLLVLGMLLISLAFLTLGQAQDRFMDLWESFKSILGTSDYASLFNTDATSRLRLESWQDAIAIIKSHPLLGSGYNSYKYAQWNMGLISDIDLHHSTGSDSTLLNIFATTGILGLTSYLLFYGKALLIAIKNSAESTQISAYNLGLMGGLVAILVHATFVNSLLFPHILIFFWISLGLSTKIKPVS